jgi:molecular chaperone IbpA
MWDLNENFVPKNLDKFLIGFDPIVKKMTEAADQTVKLSQNYPPYNIKKIDENRYVIEMAVAGFCKQDLEVELVDGKLVVKGTTQRGDESTDDGFYPTYIHQGLAMRPFTRAWTLADNVEIQSGELTNGILKIWLEALTPETKKVKIDIKEGKK